jgi:hypothetical protein
MMFLDPDRHSPCPELTWLCCQSHPRSRMGAEEVVGSRQTYTLFRFDLDLLLEAEVA